MKTQCILFLLSLPSLLEAQIPRLVIPIGHTDLVSSVAFSPDGKTVLTGSDDNTAKLWDLHGREVQTFKGHTDPVTSVAFSPDGKTVLTGSADNTAKLWDLDGREVQTFRGQIRPVNSVAFSPDGKTVLTSSWDNTAKLWDLDGNLLRTFYGVKSAVFSPAGNSILTGSSDSTAKLWNLQGQVLQTFTGHAGTVHSVAFSPAGNSILTVSSDSTARLWNLQRQVLQTFADPAGAVRAVAFSPTGNSVLAVVNNTYTAKLWDLKGRELQTFAHADFVMAVAFSPDGKTVMTGSWDKTAKLWDLDGREVQTFKGHASAVTSVAFSPDGKTALTGNFDNTAKRWDLDGRELKPFMGHAWIVRSVAFAPDGKTALTGSWDKTAKLWDLDGRELKTFDGHADKVESVAFSPDGKTVLTGSADETAKLWDVDGRELQTFAGHIDDVWSVAFSPDGKTVLTGSADNTAKLWDLYGRALQTFKGHTDELRAVAFAPDGKTILTGSVDNTAKLWDLNGRALQTFRGHASGITSVAFSPDGKTVLTGSFDNTAKLWNAQTGQELATLIAIDAADWVVTTPSGLFDASSGAMQRMHYAVGLEAIELEQLKQRYYEPGLLQKILGFSTDPLRTVSGFDTVALYPEVALQLDTLQNKLHIRLTARNGGIGKVSVFINGKEIREDANPPEGYENIRNTDLSIELAPYARYFLFDTLNTVSVRAYNAEGWLKSAPYSVAYRPVFARAKNLDGKAGSSGEQLLGRDPALHAILVGTADYAGAQLDLKYAAKDARDMASAIQQIGTQLFGHFGPDFVSVHLLTTDTSDHTPPPTKANIQAVFDTIKNRAKAEDILVVYFSGHGVSYGDADQALFYYLTMDLASDNLSDPGIRARSTISSAELARWIVDIPALKQVLVFDACNSGRVLENLATGQKALNSSQIRALDRMKDRTGMFVLTGSAADKVSYEAGKYGQGLLTYSLLEGIKKLGAKEKGRVDVMQLFQHARDEVPELAKGIGGIQKPMLVGPLGGSFDIGIVNEKVKIELESTKSVFIRNQFTHAEYYADSLGLTTALENYLIDLPLKNPQAKIIYMDVPEYEDAYSIKGLYTVSGSTVTVRGRLFKGKTAVGEPFEVLGEKEDLPALTKAILAAVGKYINRKK